MLRATALVSGPTSGARRIVRNTAVLVTATPLFIAARAGDAVGAMCRMPGRLHGTIWGRPCLPVDVDAADDPNPSTDAADVQSPMQPPQQTPADVTAPLSDAWSQIAEMQVEMYALKQQGTRQGTQLKEQRQRLGELQASNQQLSGICGHLQVEIADARARHQSLFEAHELTLKALHKLNGEHGTLQVDYKLLQAEIQLMRQNYASDASKTAPAPSQELICAVKRDESGRKDMVMYYSTVLSKLDAFLLGQTMFGNPQEVISLKPRGIFLSAAMSVAELGAVVQSVPDTDVNVVLVVEVNRLANLQGLGYSALGISTGGFELQCKELGLDPAHTLPCVMDKGTDRKADSEDPSYKYLKHAPVPDDDFWEVFYKFEDALYKRWPNFQFQLANPPPELPPPAIAQSPPFSPQTGTSSGTATTAGTPSGSSNGATSPPVKLQKGEGEAQQMRKELEAAITTRSSVKWEDVVGLKEAKAALQEAVTLPLQYPHFFTDTKLKPWSGVLLYGPPGTGKTHLAQAVAGEAGATFFSVSSSDLMSKWLGDSERLVKQLFAMAQERAPSVVFIDEIDALCCARGEGGSESMRRVKTEMMVQMTAIQQSSAHVLMLAATNCPMSLDEAVRRRFTQRIYIPLPDKEARADMLKTHLQGERHSFTQADFHNFAACTDGFSGSDIAAVAQDALYQPFRLTNAARFFRPVQGSREQHLEACSKTDP